MGSTRNMVIRSCCFDHRCRSQPATVGPVSVRDQSRPLGGLHVCGRNLLGLSDRERASHSV
jgi:hypothetical protein